MWLLMNVLLVYLFVRNLSLFLFSLSNKLAVIKILKVGDFMFTINIENNIVICILIILIFIAIMYYIKRKYDSIDKYNDKVSDKFKTYKENQTQYQENLKDIGLSDKEIKTISKILKFLKNKNRE